MKDGTVIGFETAYGKAEVQLQGSRLWYDQIEGKPNWMDHNALYGFIDSAPGISEELAVRAARSAIEHEGLLLARNRRAAIEEHSERGKLVYRPRAIPSPRLATMADAFAGVGM